LEAVIVRHPSDSGHTEARCWAADRFVYLKEYDRAEKLLTDGLGQRPLTPEAETRLSVELAYVLHKKGDAEGALSQLELVRGFVAGVLRSAREADPARAQYDVSSALQAGRAYLQPSVRLWRWLGRMDLAAPALVEYAEAIMQLEGKLDSVARRSVTLEAAEAFRSGGDLFSFIGLPAGGPERARSAYARGLALIPEGSPDDQQGERIRFGLRIGMAWVSSEEAEVIRLLQGNSGQVWFCDECQRLLTFLALPQTRLEFLTRVIAVLPDAPPSDPVQRNLDQNLYTAAAHTALGLGLKDETAALYRKLLERYPDDRQLDWVRRNLKALEEASTDKVLKDLLGPAAALLPGTTSRSDETDSASDMVAEGSPVDRAPSVPAGQDTLRMPPQGVQGERPPLRALPTGPTGKAIAPSAPGNGVEAPASRGATSTRVSSQPGQESVPGTETHPARERQEASTPGRLADPGSSGKATMSPPTGALGDAGTLLALVALVIAAVCVVAYLVLKGKLKRPS